MGHRGRQPAAGAGAGRGRLHAPYLAGRPCGRRLPVRGPAEPGERVRAGDQRVRAGAQRLPEHRRRHQLLHLLRPERRQYRAGRLDRLPRALYPDPGRRRRHLRCVPVRDHGRHGRYHDRRPDQLGHRRRQLLQPRRPATGGRDGHRGGAGRRRRCLDARPAL